MQELNTLAICCKGAHFPLVSEPHSLRHLLRWLPLGLAVTVGVTVANEVGPVVCHLGLNGIIFLLPCHVGVRAVGQVVEAGFWLVLLIEVGYLNYSRIPKFTSVVSTL